MRDLFKWRHYEAQIILTCVRWYLRYALSYRDLEEMMTERGWSVDHSTIFRWVQQYAPELDKRSRPYLQKANDSWRVDETYAKVRGQWMYLYRAVDSTGQALDFLLNETHSTRAAKCFFRKTLSRPNVIAPRVINVDKNPAYTGAIQNLKQEKRLPEQCKRRPSQFMNNLVEQDHRFIKHRIRPGLGVGSYPTVWRTIQGYETMHRIRKGQIEGVKKGHIQAQNTFIARLFGLAAYPHIDRFVSSCLLAICGDFLQHNPQRIHSALSYLTPAEFEAAALTNASQLFAF